MALDSDDPGVLSSFYTDCRFLSLFVWQAIRQDWTESGSFLSSLFWAGVSPCFLASHSIIAIFSAFVLFGLHKAALDPVQRAFFAELAPREHTVGILGSFQMVIGLCSLPASLLAGLLWETFGSGGPFAFSIFLTLLASPLLLFVREGRDETE